MRSVRKQAFRELEKAGGVRQNFSTSCGRRFLRKPSFIMGSQLGLYRNTLMCISPKGTLPVNTKGNSIKLQLNTSAGWKHSKNNNTETPRKNNSAMKMPACCCMFMKDMTLKG